MALAYLLDPCLQYQNRAGVNNVAGYLEVFRMDTDDRATVYVDFNGTLAPEHIGIDNDGRAVMIVESGRPYRVEMHGPNGDLFWTQQPVWTVASGGGGVSGTDIVSSDGSISVDKTTVGSFTTYDLSSHVNDSTELLGWIRCDGASNIDGTDIWKPTYTAGTLMVGERGVMLTGGQYFHATARVRVTKTGVAPYYDDMNLVFSIYDGDTAAAVAGKGIVVDGSMGLSQDFEISCDVLPEYDCELLLEITGKELASVGVQVLDMEVHRVFSGAPYIPGGVANKPWVENNYQEKLTAGANIDIINNIVSTEKVVVAAGQNVSVTSSSDPSTRTITYTVNSSGGGGGTSVQSSWTETDPLSPAYIQNKPSLAEVATSGSYDDLSNRPTIPTSDQLVPSSSSSDDGKVLTVDANGDAEWAMPVSEIPDVTASDNGKVLTATYSGGSGSYSWQPGMSSEDVFVAEYGVTTWEEINAAFLANKALFAYHNGHTYVMSDMVYEGGLKSVTFANVRSENVQNDNDWVQVWLIRAQSTGLTTWSIESQSGGYLIQAPDNGDEGKVLKVKSTLGPGSNIEWGAAPTFTQEQANWTESDNTLPSYVKNKPTVKNLIAGAGISITETAQGIVIALA